jgi:flagellin-like hook-associated protein FlgL
MTASSGSAYINAMTLGQDGYLYTAGPMNGAIDGQQAGQEDFLVSKYGTDGQRIWSKLLGAGIGVEVAHAITVGSDGSIYVAGSTNGSLSNPSTQTDEVADVLVAKFSPDGTLQWAKQMGTVNDDRAFSLTTGADGAVYLTGATTGNMDGSSTATGGVFALNPAADTFITKIDEDGNTLWTHQLEGTRVGNGIAAGADGAIYVVGEMNGTFNLGASRSGIMDADYAKETVAMAKGQIIAQATTAVLAQANQRPQDVLKLLGEA